MMEIYTRIAKFFNYPNGDYQVVAEEIQEGLSAYGEFARFEFLPVVLHFTTTPVSELQEYYVRTFDVNAACYLDVGYVLFGEESKRGQFLLNMKKEQLKAGNDCGKEFPDHLPNFLSLLPLMEDEMFREELVVTLLLPALKHMIANFRTEENCYRHLLNLLVRMLETDFIGSAFEPYEIDQKEIECAGIYSCGMDFTKITGRKN
jgi:nitrate reductase assembly molybdenum cofactor insertion protein NarJ